MVYGLSLYAKMSSTFHFSFSPENQDMQTPSTTCSLRQPYRGFNISQKTGENPGFTEKSLEFPEKSYSFPEKSLEFPEKSVEFPEKMTSFPEKKTKKN